MAKAQGAVMVSLSLYLALRHPVADARLGEDVHGVADVVLQHSRRSLLAMLRTSRL